MDLLEETKSDVKKTKKIGSLLSEKRIKLLLFEPNNTAIVTTQFDILYDDKMEYTVGIIPDRFGLQNAKERVFVCITNC